GSTFSYGILDNTWIVEYPNVGIPGDTIMANIADEVNWTYDSKRNLFYWLGGFGGSWCYGWPIGTKSNGVTYTDPPIAFNPVTRKWQTTNLPNIGTEHTVYDPVTDTLIALSNDWVIIYHFDTGTQESLPITGNLNALLQDNNIYSI